MGAFLRCNADLWCAAASAGMAGELPASQSDSEGSNSSLELTAEVGSTNGQGAIKCRWAGCGRWFGNLEPLASHVTRVHAASGQGGLFYCGWEGCGRGDRGFNARYKMLVHVRTHTNEKPHHCFKCDKSFSRAENLKIHARSHTGERPYVCPVSGCGKAYSNSSDRFKHTRTHSVDKPYSCKVPGCPKRYTDPSSLRKHVKTYRHFLSEGQLEEDGGGKRSAIGSKYIQVSGESLLSSPALRQDVRLWSDPGMRYDLFRSWLGARSLPLTVWSPSPPSPHGDEQDSPLDLTVHRT